MPGSAELLLSPPHCLPPASQAARRAEILVPPDHRNPRHESHTGQYGGHAKYRVLRENFVLFLTCPQVIV